MIKPLKALIFHFYFLDSSYDYAVPAEMGTVPLLNSDSTLLVTNRTLNKCLTDTLPKCEKVDELKVKNLDWKKYFYININKLLFIYS